MDKKNLTIGVALLLAAFVSMYFSSKSVPPRPVTTTPGATPTQTVPAATTPEATTNPTTTGTAVPAQPPHTEITALANNVEGAQVDLLVNNFVEVRLSNYGGAIREVALRKFAETLDSKARFTFNKPRTNPMLGIVDLPGLGRDTGFSIVSQNASEVVYRAVFENRIEVTRRYFLPDGSAPGTDPYQLRHETTFRNLTDQTLPLPRIALSLGTASPIDDTIYGQELTTGYSDGKDQHFIEHTKLQGGGFLAMIGMGSKEPTPFITSTGAVAWSSLSNQFFTSILTPDQSGVGMITRRVPLPSFASTPDRPNFGLSAETQFDVPSLPPQGSATIGMNLYVGPKEYRRLANADIFRADQDKVMNFGFFSFFSQILLTMMSWVHSWMFSLSPTWAWGWAVVITTLILKTVFLPLTLAASRSGKRMQKIQPEMKELREKFKDNPQKMQAATMELFKRHKVNPMGGCIPILLTMPFFFGFFVMLRSAAELRFESFLWASDLSHPDTIAHIFGLPLNIMPILMGATMIIQMRLTPMPTADNAQAKIFKFMPWMFTLFCYNFSCALALYSTVNGLFTIGQQLIINRMEDPIDTAPAAPVTATTGKKVKNVTPRKKK
ncbi:MAG: YidC/Oxa1 family insertase periplasmic-domain containing protein [Cephaloticoccus sp.]|nr:YidC/Oxa1 family insertase periplasmic-domain containing protein [Cephaloticoccus sp.]MCF7760563.1 YidC/Oxa1 family insertase periplasmic-domain containing protein [Cephaloticoccus sp.]